MAVRALTAAERAVSYLFDTGTQRYGGKLAAVCKHLLTDRGKPVRNLHRHLQCPTALERLIPDFGQPGGLTCVM